MNPAELLLKSDPLNDSGKVIFVGPEEAGWEYISLRIQQITAGNVWNYVAEHDEVCLLPLSGTCDVECDGERWTIGGRRSVFTGKPHALYLPVGSKFRVTAGDDVELAVAAARATRRFPTREITPDDVAVEIRGAGNATRQINHIIKPEFPADKLLVVEVFTPSGNWSSYPPHKHDVSNMPSEADLEEIYYYRIAPPDGFGLQRLYTADGSIDAAYIIKDGDLLLVPEGYHVFAVAQGYTGYYLNVLAGDEAVRTMQPIDDPAYAWVRETWTDDMNEGISDWRDIDARINRGAGHRKAQKQGVAS